MKKTAYICLLVFIGSLFGCVDKFEEDIYRLFFSYTII